MFSTNQIMKAAKLSYVDVQKIAQSQGVTALRVGNIVAFPQSVMDAALAEREKRKTPEFRAALKALRLDAIKRGAAVSAAKRTANAKARRAAKAEENLSLAALAAKVQALTERIEKLEQDRPAPAAAFNATAPQPAPTMIVRANIAENAAKSGAWPYKMTPMTQPTTEESTPLPTITPAALTTDIPNFDD